MSFAKPIPLSVLDLSFVREGEGPAEALHESLAVAQKARQRVEAASDQSLAL